MAKSPEHPQSLTRREIQRRARRQQRARVVAASMAVVVAIAAVALVLTDTLRIPDGRDPVLADDGALAETEIAAAGERVDPTRALTPEDPLRLWIAGDSLAGSLGPSLGEMTAATGVVRPVFDSRVSSGLNSPDFFDWPEHATEELARLQPEAVVFEIGANDAKVLPDGDDWRGDYGAKVDAMMRLLVGNGRDVYWVGVPPMSDSSFNERARDVNTVVQEVASGHPEVTYVDAYTLFADDDGDYASSLTDADGDTVTLRAGDGVHLTAEGGDLMAEAVFYRLDNKWDITGQERPDQPQEVVQTEGSSQIQGTYRPPSSSSSSSGDSSTATTTAPSTTPPETSPPETTPDTTPTPSTEAPPSSSTTTIPTNDPG